MIITLSSAATDYALTIANLYAALITPTFLSCLNNGIYSMLDV